MNLQASFFSIPNPIDIFDRLVHPWRRVAEVPLRGHSLKVICTARAERAFKKRDKPLIAEMQLYFSCVVKKRVLFFDETDIDTIRVNDDLQLMFRPVQSQSCSPEEFARNFPVKHELKSEGAIKMHPKTLQIDYKNGEWQGQFYV